jgi:hypothetical protein
MHLPRFVGLVDLAVATVVLVAIVLPPREMFAAPAQKGSEADQFALALSEARTIAHPDDGQQVDDLARRLGTANFKDWAIETSVHGAERAKNSPTAWRALLATSVAYIDRLDVKPGLEYADKALAACDTSQPSCPTWEQIRLQIYQHHLDAGVKSGFDPRRGPAAAAAFRKAGEASSLQVHLGGHDVDQAPGPHPTTIDAGP